MEDLVGLVHLHEPAILHNLRIRFEADQIYTSTGPILLAVNPFKPMENLYDEDIIAGCVLRPFKPAICCFNSARLSMNRCGPRMEDRFVLV